MPRKKADTDAPARTGQHAAVQVVLPHADVYYLDEDTKARVEAKQRKA